MWHVTIKWKGKKVQSVIISKDYLHYHQIKVNNIPSVRHTRFVIVFEARQAKGLGINY